MDFSLSVGYFGSDGFDATKPGAFGHAPDKDGYRNQNFSGKIAYHLDARNELGLTVFQSDGHTHLDNDPTIDAVTHQTLSAFSVYSSNQITDAWQSILRAGQGQDKSTTTGAFPSFFATRQPQYTWQNNIKIGPGTAIAGAEYLIQDVTSDSTFALNQRTVKSGFAGYLGAYGKHDWQANVRVDDNSQFGSHTTGLLGYAYRPTDELRLRVGAGTAFKAPTFNDLYLVDPSGLYAQSETCGGSLAAAREAGVNYQTRIEPVQRHVFRQPHRRPDHLRYYRSPHGCGNGPECEQRRIRGVSWATRALLPHSRRMRASPCRIRRTRRADRCCRGAPRDTGARG
jgi:vitamin B12 transporter